MIVSGSGITESSYDNLYINDGNENHKYSGSFNISNLVTAGNTLTIELQSDSSVVKDGYELTVTLVSKDDVCPVNYVYGDDTVTKKHVKDSVIELAKFDDLFSLPVTDAFVCWRNGDNDYSERSEYTVTGEVTFTAVTEVMPVVTFDGNGAVLITDSEKTQATFSVPKGTKDLIPHSDQLFVKPDGKYFGGWTIDGRVYEVGEEFTVTGDVTATAIWRDANEWDSLNESLADTSVADHGTITLTKNVTAVTGSYPLTVPKGVSVTIDLNGYTLDGTQAAVIDQNAIVVYGSLTFTDSSADTSGAVTGGCITVIEDAEFYPNSSVSDSFEATLTQSYVIEDNNGVRTDYTYSVAYCPTLAGAMTAASEEQSYKSQITMVPDIDNYNEYGDFWYNDSKVALLKDVTVAQGETLEANSTRSIWLNLNGHTFDVQGTFTGGYDGVSWQNGEYQNVFYPTNIQIVSTTTGTFRSSGTLGVNLEPWTEDTYYITGGTINGEFFADGGTFHISGGHFTNMAIFNNGNEDAAIEVDISGDAELDRLEHMVYPYDDYKQIHMSISGNARIKNMVFRILGTGAPTSYPVLTVNGGYFSVDPRTWQGGYSPVDAADVDQNNLSQYYVYYYGNYKPYDELTDEQKQNATDFYIYYDNYYEDIVQIVGTSEQFTDQDDWAADSGTYTWRVKPLNILYGDVNGDGIVSIRDATLVQMYLAQMVEFDAAQLLAADADGNGTVDINDVTRIQQYLVGMIDSLR